MRKQREKKRSRREVPGAGKGSQGGSFFSRGREGSDRRHGFEDVRGARASAWREDAHHHVGRDAGVQVWRSCDTAKARVLGETRQPGVGRWPRDRGDGGETNADAFVCRGTHPRKKTDGSKRNESTYDARIEGPTNDERAFPSRRSHVPFRVPRPRLVAHTASTRASLPTHKHASGFDRGRTWTARRCKTRTTCVSLRRLLGLHIEVRNIRYKRILARAARLGRRTRSIPSQEACRGSTSTTFAPTTRSWSRRHRSRPRAVRDLFGQTPHLERWRIFLHGSTRYSFHVHARRSIVRQSFVRSRASWDRSIDRSIRRSWRSWLGNPSSASRHAPALAFQASHSLLLPLHVRMRRIVPRTWSARLSFPFATHQPRPSFFDWIRRRTSRLFLPLSSFFSLSLLPTLVPSLRPLLPVSLSLPIPSTWFCRRVVDLPWRAWSTKADAHGPIHTCGGVATQTLPHPLSLTPTPSLNHSLNHSLSVSHRNRHGSIRRRDGTRSVGFQPHPSPTPPKGERDPWRGGWQRRRRGILCGKGEEKNEEDIVHDRRGMVSLI